MAFAKRTRSAQWPLVAEYVFNYNDVFVDLGSISAASQDLSPKPSVKDFGVGSNPGNLMSGLTYAGTATNTTTYLELIALPLGAQIIGGDMQVEIPYVGPATATLALQTSTGFNLLAATTLKAAALGGTGYASGAHTGTTVTLTVGTSHGVVAGNIINVSGITGLGAACYNGTYLVNSVTSTTIVYTCSQSAADGDTANTASAGSPTVTFTAGRTALTVPAEITASTQAGQQFASGLDLRGILALGSGNSTQGRVRVRLLYTVDGKANEVITT